MARIILLLIACSVLSPFTSAKTSCKDCLILTPYIKNGNASEARRLAEVDPGQFLGYQSYSGFVTVKNKYNSNLFFWFFPSENPTLEETPWIIWLNGGPGVTSLMGLFGIIGPMKIENGEVRERNVTWARDYSLLFVDNPVGAGFSFTDDERGYPDNEDDVGAQLLEFVLQFLEMFPELRSAPLFIAGQSYAGKYVPALGIQIHRYNEQNKPKRTNNLINLRGLSIGNGLIELRNVMHYSQMCQDLALLDIYQIAKVKMLEKEVVKFIDSNDLVDAANKFNETIEYIKKKSGVNIYNFLENPKSGQPDFEGFVTSPMIRELIHVGNATFDFNNQHVYTKMLPDFANSTKPFVEELLENYGVMIYGGQLDLILPHSSMMQMIKTLKWSQRHLYLSAHRRRIRRQATGSVVGYRTTGGNLNQVLVRGAGHTVPADQPEVAKFIMDVFIAEYK